VSRIAVLDFSGPGDMAQIARTTMITRLQASGSYGIVDGVELQRVTPAPLYDAQGRVNQAVVLEAASRLQLDAVLLGRMSNRRTGIYDMGGGATLQIGDPQLTVIAEFELLGVRTGQVLAHGQTEASYRGELQQDPASAKSERKIQLDLAAANAALVVAKIAPHQVPVNVELATAMFGPGAGSILAGNKFARAGQWPEARQRWEAALNENPASDAAMYNLGLAHEAAHDLARARQMFEAAARAADKDRYREAIARVEITNREQQSLLAQSNGGPRIARDRDFCRLPPQ
jgi:tetratricopeptide (TPR) repeat protein